MMETPDACPKCGSAVYQDDAELHADWHDKIDKIVVGFKKTSRPRVKVGANA